MVSLEPPTKELLRSLANEKESQKVWDKRWAAHVPPVFIDTVDASDSAVVDAGFKHFHETRQLRRLVLNFCDFFYTDALVYLVQGRLCVTLEELELCFNGHITDAAFPQLARLQSLKRAHFYMNPWVRSEQRVKALLRKALPKIQVSGFLLHDC